MVRIPSVHINFLIGEEDTTNLRDFSKNVDYNVTSDSITDIIKLIW